MGLNIQKLTHKLITGTTSATANEQAAVKDVLGDLFDGAVGVVPILNGEGCYIEGGTLSGGRAGMNCPAAAVALDANVATAIKVCNLTTNLWVVAFIDGGDNKGYCTAVTKSGSVLTCGTTAVFNNAVTTDIDIKKISATQFVVSYCDDGGSDYLCAKIGTVASAAITYGDETEIVAAAIKKAAGTAVAVVRSTVLAFTYQLAGDTKQYIIASTFSSSTIAAAGSAVEVSANASTYITMDMIGSGRAVTAYRDGSDTYLYTTVCTVSAAGVCVAGTAEAHTSGAASSCVVKRASENRGILSWIDSGDVHIFAFDIGSSGTTLNEGTDATLAGTHLVPYPTLFSPTSGVIAYEDDAHAGKYGTLMRFTISWAVIGSGGTVSLQSVLDIFTETTATVVTCDANDNNEIVISFVTAGASTKVLYGQLRDDIIDIRSTAASATYYCWLMPYFQKETAY